MTARRPPFPAVAFHLILLAALSVPAAHAAEVFESFEAGFGPWRANADHVLGWYIVPSEDQAHDGSASLDFSADGRNDDGTLWIVREIQLDAGTSNVSLEFFVHNSGGGLFGQWTAIGFIGTYEPLTEEDFTQTADGQSFGGITQSGWQSFSMQRTIQAGQPTTAYVALGYNIVFETQRTHHFDSVTIGGVPVQCGYGSCFGGEDSCNCAADCGPPAADETDCTNGTDDDCDGHVDCVDAACKPDPVCAGIACDGDDVCEQDESPCDCFVDCGPPALLETECSDGLDNDCNGQTDCADLQFCGANPPCFGCFAPPGEVSPPGSSEPLLFGDAVTLTWETGSASLSDTFNVYRGDADTLAVHHGPCLESGVSTNSTSDTASPPPGSAFTYLVSGQNCLGEGPLGQSSAGADRVPAAPCP